jgi:plastocyanin
MKRYALLAAVLALASCGSAPQPAEPKAAAPAYFKPDPATAGVIKGRIQITGRKPAPKTVSLDADPACAKLHAGGRIQHDNGLTNVFVYLKTGLEGKTFAVPVEPVVIDQKGCWFAPRVIGIQKGQTFRVTNSDPVTHNIHPQPRSNRDWNQSQSPEDPPLVRKFTAPEIMIPVKCNVHNWMRAWIGVVEHPYFAVTGPDGSFEIRNVPPGSYTVEAWQEDLGFVTLPVAIAPSATKDLTFTFKGI